MKYGKSVYVLIGFLVVMGAGAHYFRKMKAKPGAPINAAQSPVPLGTTSPAKPAGVEMVNPADVAEKVANFLGSLTPGGTAESAGHERQYVVSYQVDFFRKKPKEKASEESMPYSELSGRDTDKMPPYVYYGEMVSGKYDPAQPEVIAVHAKIDGKETQGYIDASKLWLEPHLDRPESDRYMAVTETTSIHVVPDRASPAVMTILQGEVVDTVGRLNFKGQSWVKARFNAPERPRYGFIPGSEVMPITLASVNQSVVGLGGNTQTDSRFKTGFFGNGPAEAFPERVLHRGNTAGERN